MSKLSPRSDRPLTHASYNPETRKVRRFLFYSHDGLGVGHVRRNLAIARALAEVASDASILILTAADDVAGLGLPPRVITVKLPGPHRSDQRVVAAAVEIFRPLLTHLQEDSE